MSYRSWDSDVLWWRKDLLASESSRVLRAWETEKPRVHEDEAWIEMQQRGGGMEAVTGNRFQN